MAKKMTVAETYNQGQIAEKAGVTRKTVKDWTGKGKLPNPTREGRQLKYDAKATDAFIQKRAEAKKANA